MTRKSKTHTEQEKALLAKYERLRELREQLETKLANSLKGPAETPEVATILDASKDAALIKARLGSEALSAALSQRERPHDDSEQPPPKRQKVSPFSVLSFVFASLCCGF